MTTTATRTAQTILDQIGVPALMRLGAHEITRYADAVTFKVKIAKPGQTRARIMRAKIVLTASDLYDVSIGMLERSLDWYNLADLEGADAEQMAGMMRRLAARA